MSSGNPAAGLLLLVVGVFLLLSYFTGRLDWLFALGRDVNAGRTGAAAPPPAGAPVAARPVAPGTIPYPRQSPS